jgi:DUF4097 and DUF4098 domain-containing protein YvlB
MREGRLVVDGVALGHERWVDVSLDASDVATLAIDTAGGPIELTGDPSGSCVLAVHVWSQREDDGEVYISSGRLRVRSQQRARVFIDGVRGTVPEGLALDLSTAAGPITLERTSRGRTLLLDSTSGDVSVHACQPASIRVGTSSGSVLVEQTSAVYLRARTSSGDVTVRAGTWGSIRSETASGGLRLEGCTAEGVELESSSGNLVISGGHCRKASIDSSGELSLVDGATVDQVGDN